MIPSRPRLAVRGALTGAIVAAVVISTLFIPKLLGPSEDGWRDLGLFVLFLLLSPVVAFVVALLAGWLLGLRRPWAVALAGPAAGYAVMRAYAQYVDVSDRIGPAAVTGAVLLTIGVYAGLAVLVAPLPWPDPWPLLVRVATAVVLVTLAMGASALSGARADQERIDELTSVGVPLVHPGVPGFVPVAAMPIDMSAGRYLYIRLARGADEPGSTIEVRVVPSPDVTGLTCVTARTRWIATGVEDFIDAPCREVTPVRWAYTYPDGSAIVLESRGGALVQWSVAAALSTGPAGTDSPLVEVTAKQLAPL